MVNINDLHGSMYVWTEYSTIGNVISRKCQVTSSQVMMLGGEW